LHTGIQRVAVSQPVCLEEEIPVDLPLIWQLSSTLMVAGRFEEGKEIYLTGVSLSKLNRESALDPARDETFRHMAVFWAALEPDESHLRNLMGGLADGSFNFNHFLTMLDGTTRSFLLIVQPSYPR
jgi:hypothetical protein